MRGLRTLAAVGGFWAHQQVGDLLAYLRALANPLDELALYGDARLAARGSLTRRARAARARRPRARRAAVWETCSAPRDGEASATSLAERGPRGARARSARSPAGERERASARTISELIERAIDASGYREHVLGLEWGERRLANVHKLLRLARRFEASEGRDLRGFLDHVAHLQGGERRARSPTRPSPASSPTRCA